MNQQNLIKTIVQAIRQSEPKTKAYDTQARVTRIDGSTAWVHIPGGVAETPVKLTIAAKAGDTVQVRVSGGRAFLVGNSSAPPTDDRVAKEAVKQVGVVKKTLTVVKEVAEKAQRIAGNTNQYFWHTQEGIDTGAHITEIPQDEFLADPANGGGNLLARSNGIAVRDGLDELATFGASGSVVGETDKTHLEMDYHSIQGKAREGTYFYVSDLRDATGYATVNYHFEAGASMDDSYPLFMDVVQFVSVKQNDMETSAYTYDSSIRTITFTAVNDYDWFDVIFTTTDVKAKAYTMGVRASGSSVVPMSFAEGYGNEASGYASHAEGAVTQARNQTAHAEGYYTQAVGKNSHAEGNHTFASGKNSHAGGFYTRAFGDNQTVIGKYNVADANGPLFIVGNGTSSNPSDAFRVESNGEAYAQYRFYASSNNISYAMLHRDGFIHLSRNGSPAIYFHRNNSDSYSTYLAETADGQLTASGDLKANGDLNANGNVVAGDYVIAGDVLSYDPQWASGQNANNYHCVVSAGICHLFYQGQAVAHSAGASIGTLRVGSRPTGVVYAPFVKMAGNAFGVISISTAGAIKVAFISDTTNTGRIYFNCTFPVV